MRARPFVPFFVTWYCHDVPKGLLAGMGRGWEGRDVLEAGCGGGSLLFALADEARRVHGVDISQDAIGFLRSRYVGAYDNLSVQACDFADFEATEPFDLVLSNDCFEHVDNGPGFVGAAARSLRPDGALLLQFPNHLDHGINHFSTLVDLDELVARHFAEARYFTVHPSAWHEALHAGFSGLRALAEPQLARNRRAVLADPRTRGLDDFSRSSCFTWMRSETRGGLKFQAARALNRAFRVMDRVGPSHRLRELPATERTRSILDERLVVFATGPRDGDAF